MIASLILLVQRPGLAFKTQAHLEAEIVLLLHQLKFAASTLILEAEAYGCGRDCSSSCSIGCFVGVLSP